MLQRKGKSNKSQLQPPVIRSRHSVTMKVVVFLLSINVALVKSLDPAVGFVGDNVTLHPRANPSWDLSTIEWSIFSNNTWIATYQNKKPNLDRVQRYVGRLTLNVSTGDLTIHNLKMTDAMEYTIDLINTEGLNSVQKIKLDVKRRLQEPVIETIANKPVKGGCWIGLQCSSQDSGVRFTWQITPPHPVFTSERDPQVLFTLLNTTRGLTVTCNSSSASGSAFSSFTPTCEVAKPTPHLGPDPLPSCRSGLFVFLGFILGFFLTLIIFLISHFREKIKSACERLTSGK